MKNLGWIKLDRSIMDHWIFQDDRKFKWWLSLLMLANHEPKKTLLQGVLVEIARGELVRIYESLALIFNCSKGSVKNFLKMLESDNMVKLENLKVATRITICNYGTYQDTVNTDCTTDERKMNAKYTANVRPMNAEYTSGERRLTTNKNDKHYKNDKNEKKPDSKESFVDPNQIYRQHYKIL